MRRDTADPGGNRTTDGGLRILANGEGRVVGWGHVEDKHCIGANDQGVCEICEGRENERFPTRLCDEASLQTVKNDLRF